MTDWPAQDKERTGSLPVAASITLSISRLCVNEREF